MGQTKKQKEKVRQAMLQTLPKEYRGNNYPFSIRSCPGYERYIPINLKHEVCKYCGSHNYYH